MLTEAVGPLVVIVDGQRFVVAVPDADDVCQLDDTTNPLDVLDLLAGDLFDDLLDLLEERPASELAALADQLRRHFAVLHLPPQGITTIVEELELYGEAIEYDLHQVHHLDPHDWVRHHETMPWAKMLRLIWRLPPGSHYAAARGSDVELALSIKEREHRKQERTGKAPATSTAPSLIGWTTERELLTQISDAARRIEHGVWSASPKFEGTGGAAPKPAPRPHTAFDEVAEAATLTEHDEIMTALLGDRYRPPAGQRLPNADAVRGAVLLDPR